MSEVHRTPIQIRFGDTDALGHVNNASFAAYAELGRLDFLGRLGGFIGSIILANLSIDFRRQVRFTEEVYVETSIAAIGRSSATLRQVVWAGGERAAEISSVVVHFDYETHASRPLPDSMREALAPFLPEPAGDARSGPAVR
jgi:acyl-CoA thioester hydrolase